MKKTILTNEQIIALCDKVINKLEHEIPIYMYEEIHHFLFFRNICMWFNGFIITDIIPEFTHENAINYGNAYTGDDFYYSQYGYWWDSSTAIYSGGENPHYFDFKNRIKFLKWIKEQYINK